MQESTSKEKILKAVRDALVNPASPPCVDEDYVNKIYHKHETPYDEVIFAEALAKVGGQFVYNSNTEEFAANLKEFMAAAGINCLHCYDPILQQILNDKGIFCFNARDDFHECEIGVTGCEYLIARTGSVMVSSRQQSGRKSFFWPPLHIVIAWRDQLVYDIRDAIKELNRKYFEAGMPSMVTLITGPSRTADIEKTLVMGAHGPAKLIVFFIDEPSGINLELSGD